ncbi:hypothetical protein OQ968_11815 [Mycobacterium sp. 663a-19]|uniref:hypothetical protein n=1 Tax=Mycobacterium sp. 663a-19 TaxID=2986148 RepID=UPI002D1F3209|nr:hypothetical protein [Mycobacterium sp. 663a-19]MEB3981951.1 hypothetical protein [Mycobacterium sp. 663a-19]
MRAQADDPRMTHHQLSPIPPPETATDPVRSCFDLQERWRALMGPLGFGQRLLWVGFLGPDRCLVKTLGQVPIGSRPRARIMKILMSSLRTRLDDMASGTTVTLLLTGPGRGPISPNDRLWAKVLTDIADRFAVPLERIFRANDESLDPVEVLAPRPDC